MWWIIGGLVILGIAAPVLIHLTRPESSRERGGRYE